MLILPITEDLYPQVARIYEEGICTGIATFETTVPPWEKWDASHHSFGRIILKDGDNFLGWAALSPVSGRFVYRGLSEATIYMATESRGKGFGKIVLNKLIEISEANEIWTLQSSIFRANTASLQLHLSCGFREIGFKEKVGQLHGVWLDTILLERRSKITGI